MYILSASKKPVGTRLFFRLWLRQHGLSYTDYAHLLQGTRVTCYTDYQKARPAFAASLRSGGAHVVQ